LTSSLLAQKTHSILRRDDHFTWHLADACVRSGGDATTFWIHDGSKTGLPTKSVAESEASRRALQTC